MPEEPAKAVQAGRVEPELPQLPPNPNRTPTFQKRRLKPLHEAKAADALIQYMNGEGKTGLFAASELEDYWELACDELDIAHLDIRLVRSALMEKGCHVGQRRLKTGKYAEVHLRTGMDRAVLYRIPKLRIGADSVPEVPIVDPEVPRAARRSPATRSDQDRPPTKERVAA